MVIKTFQIRFHYKNLGTTRPWLQDAQLDFTKPIVQLLLMVNNNFVT